MKDDRTKETIIKFQSGSSCAQAVLSTYLPQLGVPEPIAHKMGAGLGGGIGRKQYICGALNAGAIVLSTYLGNETNDDSDRKESSSLRVRQLIEGFEQEFGSSQCIDLLGADINTEEGKKIIADANKSRTVCDKCVEHVCHQIEEVLDQQ